MVMKKNNLQKKIEIQWMNVITNYLEKDRNII